MAVKLLLQFFKPHIPNLFRSYSEIQKSPYMYLVLSHHPLRVNDI